MRVLYIHQYFSTRAGATGTRSYEFARYLVTRHHKVTMLTSTAWLDVGRKRLVTRMSVDGIDVVAIGVGYSNHMSMLARLWSFASFMVMATFEALRAEADVVYASSTPLTVGVPGLLAARRRRVPFVFEVRDLWPEAPIELGVLKAPLLIWIARKLEEYLYARADHIVTLSEGMAEGGRAKGVPAERVTVITNAADTDLFAPGPKDAETVARYGLEDAFVVAYVGAMGPIHAIDQIVAAAQIVAKREEAEEREGGGREASPNTASHPSPPRTVFLLAGDGRTRAGLEARTRELGLDNVIWAGPVAKSAVPRLLATADVALVTVAPFPVLEKSSCNKAFDALAAGRPIVMNYGGWLAEAVTAGGAGVATAPGDPAALADALLALRDDPARRVAMGEAARRLAETDFDRERMARRLEILLASLIGPSAWRAQLRPDREGARGRT